MKISLLTGTFENKENICYALEKFEDELFIDYQLKKILGLNYDVDVVLGYKYSEEIMRKSKYLKQCNIVFDPNEKEGPKRSNLFAGLYTVYGESFFLPIQYQSPSLVDWQKMITRLFQVSNEGYHILRPYCPVDGDMAAGYPLGLTREAKDIILKNRNFHEFQEIGLNEYKMPVLDTHLSQPYLSPRQNLPYAG